MKWLAVFICVLAAVSVAASAAGWRGPAAVAGAAAHAAGASAGVGGIARAFGVDGVLELLLERSGQRHESEGGVRGHDSAAVAHRFAVAYSAPR
jgi:hypothetical protein